MKTSDMTFTEWADALAKRGSDEDPIVHNGIETTPRSLSYTKSPEERIRGVQITYSGGTPLHRIRGTCGGMLRERGRR